MDCVGDLLRRRSPKRRMPHLNRHSGPCMKANDSHFWVPILHLAKRVDWHFVLFDSKPRLPSCVYVDVSDRASNRLRMPRRAGRHGPIVNLDDGRPTRMWMATKSPSTFPAAP